MILNVLDAILQFHYLELIGELRLHFQSGQMLHLLFCLVDFLFTFVLAQFEDQLIVPLPDLAIVQVGLIRPTHHLLPFMVAQ